jgi:hypothetical protein
MGGILKRFASRDQARCALSGSASILLASSRMLPDYKRTKDPEGVYRNDARTPRRLATCQPEQNARDPLSCFATERPHLDVDARWDAINLSYAAPLSNWR